MDRHAVPRQITTFEFKLIGWFTIKQFIYLLVFAGFTVVTYFLIPVPVLNIICAVLVAILGLGLVFYKYNDRTLDTWIKNLFISLTQPSQYFYHKDNQIPAFLRDVFIYSDQQTAETHIDANAKLNSYMQQSGQSVVDPAHPKKQSINTLIHTTPTGQPNIDAQQQKQAAQEQEELAKDQPFLSGIVKNNKDEPLPNIMLYVNSEAGQVVRILKTNHNGIFATFHPLPSGNFIVSPKDLGGNYFFDTMNITIDGPHKEPLQVFSKELL